MMKKYILLFITITAFSFSTMAVNRNSTGSANWDVAGTWSPSGVPTSSDNITILEGHQVTVPSGVTASCNNLNLGDNSFGGGVTQCIVGETGVGSATLNVSGILQYSIGGGTACNLNIRESSTVSITGNVVFDAGGTSDRLIFSAGASNVNVSGTFGADGTVIGGSTNGSTINFNSTTAAQVIQVSGTSYDYDNITCNNTTAGGVTLAGNLTASDINGNFTVQTGTLDMGSNSITGNVGKTFQIDAGATMEFSTATVTWPVDFGTITNNGIVEYSFAGAQIINNQDYSSLTLSGSGAKSLPATSTVTATGTLTINGTATLDMDANVENISVGAIDDNNTTDGITNATSTITFTGSSLADIDVAGTGTVTYGDIDVQNTAGTRIGTLGGVLEFADVTISGSGILNSNSKDFNVSGNWSNGGTFTQGTRKVTLTGGAAQTIGGATTTKFYDLDIANTSGGVSCTGNSDLEGTLTLTSGILTTNGQTFTITSDATRTGRVGPVGTGSVTGNVTFQRYIAGDDEWRLMGTPVGGADIEDWNGDGGTEIVMSGFTGTEDPSSSFTSVYTYNEPTAGTSDNGYIEPGNTTDALPYGGGFYMWVGDGLGSAITKTVDLIGTVATGDQVVTVTFTSNLDDDNDGWNLVSNPMPSDILWNGIARTGTLSGIAYLYNPATDVYDSYNQSDGRKIPSMQGFWVKVGTGGSGSETLTFEEVDKATDGDNFYKMLTTPPIPEFQITLTSTAPDHVHMSRVLFNTDATENYDLMHDGFMLGSLDWQVPNLGTISADSTELSLNSLPSLSQSYSIPLKVSWGYPSSMTGALVNCTLDASVISGIPTSMCLALEDLDSGIVTDLRTGSYSFVVPDTITTTRFILHIGAPTVKDRINPTCNGASDGVAIATAQDSGPWGYTWLNSSGDTVKSTSNVNTADTLSNVPAGTYTVYITTSGGYCASTVDTITLVEPATAVLTSASVVNLICFGDTVGSVDLEVTGGIPPYAYAWSNGDTVQDIGNLTAGNYIVNITDGNNCLKLVTATIVEPTEILAFNNGSDVTCTGDADGAIDLTVVGGIPPYVYSWSDGSTTEDISGLAPGTYTIDILDSSNCAVSDSFSIIQPASVTALFTTSADTVYLASGGALQFSNNSSGASQFEWDFQDGSPLSTEMSPFHVYTSLGTFNPTLIASNSNNCNDTAYKSIVVLDSQVGIEALGDLWSSKVKYLANEEGLFVSFSFDEPTIVSLQVFNVLGQEIARVDEITVLSDKVKALDPQRITGTFFIKIDTEAGSTVGKIIY